MLLRQCRSPPIGYAIEGGEAICTSGFYSLTLCGGLGAAESCVMVISWLSRAARCVGAARFGLLAMDDWVVIVFANHLRIIPGNRVKGRGLLVAVAPVWRFCRLAGSFHPSRSVASRPMPSIANEGRGSERGSFAALRAE